MQYGLVSLHDLLGHVSWIEWGRLAEALLIVAKRIHVAAVLFGGARTDARGHGLCLCCHVEVEGLGLSGRAAPFGNGFHSHDPDPAALGEGQNVARADLGRRLGDLHCIHPHMTVADLPRRKRAGLEEPGMPEPAVEAVFFGRLAQVLSFNAASTANGLSGSTFVVFSGRAE